MNANPNFPPEARHFIIQLCLREIPKNFERAHFIAHALFQYDVVAPAYNALLIFLNQNPNHQHRGLMIEVLMLFEMLLALETIYFMMPLFVDPQTAPVYAFIALYLRGLTKVNKEEVSFEAFSNAVALVSGIPVRFPQAMFLGFNFTLIAQEGLRAAFRFIHGQHSPPTDFVQNFFHLIEQNEVEIHNIQSLYGVMDVMINHPSPFQGIQILMG